MRTDDCREQIKNIVKRIKSLLDLATQKEWIVEAIEETWDVKFMCKCTDTNLNFEMETRYFPLNYIAKEWIDSANTHAYEVYIRHNNIAMDWAMKQI